MRLVWYAASSFGLALVLVPLVRLAALRFGIVDRPNADRWHRRPTPLMGGVAIALATSASLVVLRPLQPLWAVAATGLAMFAVGLADDFFHFKPSSKLVAQIGLAAVPVFLGYRLDWVESRTLDVLLSMVWMVGITNAINLLDNMDGLCAGVSLIVSVSLLASLAPNASVAPLAGYVAALAGALAGFLVYNVHPAKIFMGDGGSLFIGFTLASIALEVPTVGRDSNVLAGVAAPVLVMLIPIFDTMLVTVLRLVSGRLPSQGGRDHSSHRLVAVGLPERTAVAVLWALAALGAATGWAVAHLATGWGLITIALFVISMTLFAVFLSRVRVYEGQAPPQSQIARLTPFVVEFISKRRVAEVLMDFGLISVAYYVACRLRFGDLQFQTYFPRFLESLPMIVGVQILAFLVAGAYRGFWRHFSLMDAVVIGKGVALGTLVTIGGVLYLYRFVEYSRSVFVIYAMLLMILATASRASFRLMTEFVRRRRLGERVIIYGAGSGGELAVRELIDQEHSTRRLLGFVDDDPAKHRGRIQGYPVLGGFESLIALVEGGAVDQVVVSTPLLDRARLATLEQVCAAHDVRMFRLHVLFEQITAVS